MSFILLGILNAQAAGAAGAGDYELLETTTLASDTASVTFSGLGSYTDYKHLQLRMSLFGTRPATADNATLNFNGDTGSNYAYHFLQGDGSNVTSSAATSTTTATVFSVNAESSAADAFTGVVLDVLDFSSSSKNTTIRILGGVTNRNFIYLWSGLYNQTSAITSLELGLINNSYKTGSRFSLYGIRGA